MMPDLMEPVHTGAAAPEDAAVVVGIEDYGFLPDVPHATRDATAVHTLLTASIGIPAERVRLLSSANREQLLTAIDEAASAVGEGGRLWVWFSGHGATSPDDGSLLLVGDDAKAQQDAFAARSVSVSELSDRVAVPTLLVVDACAAGRGRAGEELLPGARFAVPSWSTGAGAVTVWTAASATELAEPYPSARHGLFTYLAAGALRGWADGALGAPDGAVSVREAHTWVQRAMAAVGSAQHPELHGPDAVVASGSLQAAPDLASLPPLRPRMTFAFADDDTEPMPVAPFRYLGGGVFEDAVGASLSRDELLRLTADRASVQSVARGQDRSLVLMGTGGAVMGVSALGALVTVVAHGIQQGSYEFDLASWQSCTSFGVTSTDFFDDEDCGDRPSEPRALASKEVVWAGTAAAGLGLVIGGDFGRRANQRKVARAVNEALQ